MVANLENIKFHSHLDNILRKIKTNIFKIIIRMLLLNFSARVTLYVCMIYSCLVLV